MEVKIEKFGMNYAVMVGDRYEFHVIRKHIQYKNVPGFTDVWYISSQPEQYFVFFRQAVIFGIKQMDFNTMAIALMPEFDKIGM